MQTFVSKKMEWHPLQHQWVVRKSLIIILFWGWAACGPVLPISNPFSGNPPPEPGKPTLKILVIDVGQGDCTLVVGPNGRTLLMDAGPAGAGLEAVLPAFEFYGISLLDWILASHYDADHIGGLPEVISGQDGIFDTEDDWIAKEALLDRGDFTSKETPIYAAYLESLPENRQEAFPGQNLDLGAGATATVIVVNGRFIDGRSIHLNPDEENEASIGILIRFGDFEYFTAGDLTGGGAPGGYETKDLETYAGEIIGDIDVLHAGHHGSATSTNEKFLSLVSPEAAMISVGKENDYGHPTEIVLQRLEDVGAQVYRTDQLGNIEITTDGEGYEISAQGRSRTDSFQ